MPVCAESNMALMSALLTAVFALVGGTRVRDRKPIPVPSPPYPSPSCMLNNFSCPQPRGWEADWSMINSTAGMCVNYTGFTPDKPWGYVTLDWNCAMEQWVRDDPADIYCEKVLAENCAELKRAGKVKRCGIYHNMELSCEWLESQRAVMDQAHVDAGWFLRYPNGTVFEVSTQAHDINRKPTGPLLRQYWIDWRNADAAAFYVDAIVNATLQPGVDATFSDDSVGLPMEHPDVQQLIGMSDKELRDLQLATEAAGQYLVTKLAVHGKFAFDSVNGRVAPFSTDWGLNTYPPSRDARSCTDWFRKYCRVEMQGRGMFMSWDTLNVTNVHKQTVAAFLVTRPAYAFIGDYGFSNNKYWSPLFALDVGEPTSMCYESSEGVFRRNWTRGVAELDCNTYTANLPFSTLDV